MRIRSTLLSLLLLSSCAVVEAPLPEGTTADALQTACFPSEFDVDCGVFPREEGGYFDVSGALFGMVVPAGVTETSAVCTGGGYNTTCMASYTDGYVHKCWMAYHPGTGGWGIACSATPSS